MDWFRMYHEFATDPKVQSMSEAMQRRLMMLLCLRCSNTLVTLQETEIAFALRIDDDELAETKVLFLRKNFINEDWEILQWDKRQFISDSSAVRVARHRAKVKAESETAQQQPCNVTVTPQNRTDTEQNRTEKASAAPKSKRSAKKPETPLPDGFAISDRVREWARLKKYDHLDRHFENFVGACRAKGYTYVDWDEGFMGAIRKDWAKLKDANLPREIKPVEQQVPSLLMEKGKKPEGLDLKALLKKKEAA